jgi:F-type H+-transporting ATPase subunit delta
MEDRDPDIAHYAEALVALGKAAGDPPRLEEDLAAALELLDRREDILRFIGDPAVTPEGKCRALDEILAGETHPVTRHFLLMLVEQGVLPRLHDIAEAFFEAAAQGRKAVSGTIASAQPLSPERIDILEQETGRILGKNVSLRPQVDPGIIGGLRVQIGDLVLDGTVNRQLEQLRQGLMK